MMNKQRFIMIRMVWFFPGSGDAGLADGGKTGCVCRKSAAADQGAGAHIRPGKNDARSRSRSHPYPTGQPASGPACAHTARRTGRRQYANR